MWFPLIYEADVCVCWMELMGVCTNRRVLWGTLITPYKGVPGVAYFGFTFNAANYFEKHVIIYLINQEIVWSIKNRHF